MLNIVKCDPEKIDITNLGVDYQIFEGPLYQKITDVIQKYNLPNDFILFIGLIEPRKNVPLLIKAYLNLLDHNNLDLDLVIAGRWGWESEAILGEY